MRTEQRSESGRRGSVAQALLGQGGGGLDRRTFLRRSGLAGGVLAALSTLPVGSVRKAEAAMAGPLTSGATVRKSICTHCAVGCTVTAEVLNGVWIGQEPSWDSPINRGSHCAKGASVRELVHSERRLRYPMKLVNGQWTRVSWETAVNEIGDKLMAIREKSSGDSVYWLGSAKMTNEGAYLFRKLGAFWGTNNTDHPVLYGMMWHILQNGWEDKEFIKQRVYGFDDLRKEVEKWNPEEVERVSGVPGEQLKRVAKMFATEKPATLIWAMGQTQKTV